MSTIHYIILLFEKKVIYHWVKLTCCGSVPAANSTGPWIFI